MGCEGLRIHLQHFCILWLVEEAVSLRASGLVRLRAYR
jgi:hypothetical protein